MNINSKGIAVVAVGFDDKTKLLTNAAISLARRFDVHLRFVSVVEIDDSDWVLPQSPIYGVAPDIFRRAREEARKSLKEQMDRLLSEIPSGVSAEGAILVGVGAERIITDAVDHGANLIMVSANVETYAPLTPKGSSKALTLMAEAPLPVLVCGAKNQLDFTKPGFAILLADDLRPDGLESVHRSYELARKLGKGTRLQHLHVHGDFREIFGDALHEVKVSLGALRDVVRDHDSLLAAETSFRRGQMESRAATQAESAKREGVEVALEVELGRVGAVIHNAADDMNADLLVFGRHKLMRAKPFIIGRMPLKAMLKDERSVLIVPPHAEWHAPMAFPAT